MLVRRKLFSDNKQKSPYKYIGVGLVRGDDGEHYDEYRYQHEKTGEVVTKRVKLPKDWAEQDKKWLAGMMAKKWKETGKKPALVEAMENAKRAEQLKAMKEKYGKK